MEPEAGGVGVPCTGVESLGPQCASSGVGAPTLTDGKARSDPATTDPYCRVRSVPPGRSGSGPGLRASRPHAPDRGAGTGRAGQGSAGAGGEVRRPEPRGEVFPGPDSARSVKRGGPRRGSRLPSSRLRLHFLLFPRSLTARSAPRRCHLRCHPRRPPPPEPQPDLSRGSAAQRRSASQRGPARTGRSQQGPRPRPAAGRGGARVGSPSRAPRMGPQEPIREWERSGALRNADSTSERAGRTMERCGCKRTMAGLGVQKGPSRGGGWSWDPDGGRGERAGLFGTGAWGLLCGDCGGHGEAAGARVGKEAGARQGGGVGGYPGSGIPGTLEPTLLGGGMPPTACSCPASSARHSEVRVGLGSVQISRNGEKQVFGNKERICLPQASLPCAHPRGGERRGQFLKI